MPPWRNWLASSAVNLKVGCSSPPGCVMFLILFFLFFRMQILNSWRKLMEKKTTENAEFRCKTFTYLLLPSLIAEICHVQGDSIPWLDCLIHYRLQAVPSTEICMQNWRWAPISKKLLNCAKVYLNFLSLFFILFHRFSANLVTGSWKTTPAVMKHQKVLPATASKTHFLTTSQFLCAKIVAYYVADHIN